MDKLREFETSKEGSLSRLPGHPERVSSHESEALKRQIDYTDREIDKLVYKLYDLTEDEIRIVEGN
ncbi:MAG: hypothetical protein E3J71_02545 [Candidatus Stahlbacteria bacterium]|nr:MAG: hypothetical protein E3J71_02545 [Candidatus Stahlbacteria bacterium]